eukprot:9830601-Ditylum_brightwellii.AAC.1
MYSLTQLNFSPGTLPTGTQPVTDAVKIITCIRFTLPPPSDQQMQPAQPDTSTLQKYINTLLEWEQDLIKNMEFQYNEED